MEGSPAAVYEGSDPVLLCRSRVLPVPALSTIASCRAVGMLVPMAPVPAVAVEALVCASNSHRVVLCVCRSTPTTIVYEKLTRISQQHMVLTSLEPYNSTVSHSMCDTARSTCVTSASKQCNSSDTRFTLFAATCRNVSRLQRTPAFRNARHASDGLTGNCARGNRSRWTTYRLPFCRLKHSHASEPFIATLASHGHHVASFTQPRHCTCARPPW